MPAVMFQAMSSMLILVALVCREEMEPERRPLPFIPRKYKTLRHVPLYQPLIRERFERCLDLYVQHSTAFWFDSCGLTCVLLVLPLCVSTRYLCPRAIKRRLQVDPETLLPKLPSPDELRPYPTTQAISVRVCMHAHEVACSI